MGGWKAGVALSICHSAITDVISKCTKLLVSLVTIFMWWGSIPGHIWWVSHSSICLITFGACLAHFTSNVRQCGGCRTTKITFLMKIIPVIWSLQHCISWFCPLHYCLQLVLVVSLNNNSSSYCLFCIDFPFSSSLK